MIFCQIQKILVLGYKKFVKILNRVARLGSILNFRSHTQAWYPPLNKLEYKLHAPYKCSAILVPFSLFLIYFFDILYNQYSQFQIRNLRNACFLKCILLSIILMKSCFNSMQEGRASWGWIISHNTNLEITQKLKCETEGFSPKL